MPAVTPHAFGHAAAHTPAPTLREAGAADIDAVHGLIREHGPNPWNYLAEPWLREHLAGFATGRTRAVLAEAHGAIVAVITYEETREFARYQPAARAGLRQGHVGEAVVHRDWRGRGLGARLLREAVARLQALGLVDIYVERHEQNAASAGMMRSAGFVVVDCFDDHERRSAGSRRTAVCRFAGPLPHPDTDT